MLFWACLATAYASDCVGLLQTKKELRRRAYRQVLTNTQDLSRPGSGCRKASFIEVHGPDPCGTARDRCHLGLGIL